MGRKVDPSVIAVVLKERLNLQVSPHYTLVHMKAFPLRSEYQEIIAYLHLVKDHFRTVRGYCIDQTGVGDVFVENAVKSGLKNVHGMMLTLSTKQELMMNVSQLMEARRLHIPRDKELISELMNVIAELTATGQNKFSHRTGTHDDRVWALALAIYGARNEKPKFTPFAAFGHTIKKPWEYPHYTPGFYHPWPPGRERVGY